MHHKTVSVHILAIATSLQSHMHVLTCMYLCAPTGTVLLMKLPNTVKKLTSLQRLRINGSGLESLAPGGIHGLRSLKELEAHHLDGALTRLPDRLAGLVSLSRLSISQEHAFTIPAALSALTALEDMSVSCTALTLTPLDRFRFPASLARLDITEAGDGGLEALPEGVSAMGALAVLRLECPRLRSLPAGVSGLGSLLQLTLTECRALTALPDAIGALTALEILTLRGCASMAVLPRGLGGATALRRLSFEPGGRALGWGQPPLLSLCFLPEEIRGLSKLEQLRLIDCRKLFALPAGFRGLTSLWKLELRGCANLQDLLEGLSRLASLRHLDLGGCDALRGRPLPEGIPQECTVSGP